MTFFGYSGLFNFIISFFLGAFVLARTKGKENLIFSFCVFAVSLWGISYYLWQISDNPGTALFWCKLLMVGAILTPITYFHYIAVFLGIAAKQKTFLVFTYALGLLFIVLDLFTNSFIAKVEPQIIFKFWPMAGPAFAPFLVMFFSLICYGCYLAASYYKKTDSQIKKQQIKYFILGTATTFVSVSTNYFLWYDIHILPYGTILCFFYVAMTAFAILRYGMFDVKMIATEFLVGVMGFALIILPIAIPQTAFKILTAGIFIFFCFIGYMLIKTTTKEIEAKEYFEERVKERTKELEASKKVAEERAAELERWYKLTIGREVRMAELKDKIKELENK
jgi:hypothetical protein